MKKTELIDVVTDYLYYTSNINIIEAEELAEEYVEMLYG